VTVTAEQQRQQPQQHMTCPREPHSFMASSMRDALACWRTML
jgi:hypothetical protein